MNSERIVDTRVIYGVKVEIQRITWKNDPGLSFDIIADGEMLTDESFDDLPTDEQIMDVLRGHASTSCYFCHRGIIGNEGHLIGNAAGWCCDDDWDERLR